MIEKIKAKIIDITGKKSFEKYLYSCFVMPFQKFKRRREYLQNAIPKKFCKKILIWNRKVVGQIEYAPAESSGLPIAGKNVFVMNCIWVLKKAKRHDFGRFLLQAALRSIKKQNGHSLATIALENHPSPWLKKEQITKLGFKAIRSVKFECKIKRKGHRFKVYLMWLSIKKNARKPLWKTDKLTEGVRFCLAHPLYHPGSIKLKQIFKRIDKKK